MTIICALHDDTTKTTYLGANSHATLGDTVAPGPSPSWFRFGKWIIAFSGEAVHTDLLELESNSFPSDADSALAVLKHLKTVFDAFNIEHQKGDWASPSYEVWGILVHQDGRVWDVDSHLALTAIPAGKLWARGSGMDFALGADHALQRTNATAKQRIRRALDAAIHHDVNCPGEPVIQTFPVNS